MHNTNITQHQYKKRKNFRFIQTLVLPLLVISGIVAISSGLYRIIAYRRSLNVSMEVILSLPIARIDGYVIDERGYVTQSTGGENLPVITVNTGPIEQGSYFMEPSIKTT